MANSDVLAAQSRLRLAQSKSCCRKELLWATEYASQRRSSGGAYTLYPQWYIDQNNGGYWSSVKYRHIGNTMNVLFVDGHVRSFTESEGIAGKNIYITRVGPDQ